MGQEGTALEGSDRILALSEDSIWKLVFKEDLHPHQLLIGGGDSGSRYGPGGAKLFIQKKMKSHNPAELQSCFSASWRIQLSPR